MEAAHTPPVAVGAFVLLGIALLIALGFEFVNGFHDTANAVATVIVLIACRRMSLSFGQARSISLSLWFRRAPSR